MARQMITCQSCGKRYDYLESESCPHCGAFNYIKSNRPHICGADDVESIIEMDRSGHTDSDLFQEAENQIDQGLQQKYARAREKLDRLETTEDVFRTSFGAKQDINSKQGRRPNPGCLKPIFILVIIVVLFNLIAPVLFALLNLDESQPESVYPDVDYSEAPADEYDISYHDGVPGYTYSIGDLDFAVGDMGILDTGYLLDPDQAVVLIRVEASCSLPGGEYADTSVYSYLSTPDFDAYYPLLDTISPDNEALIQELFGYDSYYLLQDFEISYMYGGDTATGYLPFIVDLNADGTIPSDLDFNFLVDYYNVQSGVYQSHTVCYTFPINIARTLSMEEVTAAYYNSAY